MKMLISGVALVGGLFSAAASHAQTSCTQTLSPGANIAAAVSGAAAGATICLNSGNYGSVNFWDIARSSFVTLRSASGVGAQISPQVGNSRFIKFVNLTLNDVLVNNCSASIHFINTVFVPHLGGMVVTNNGYSCSPNQDILVDGATFDQVAQAGYEGRLSLVKVNGMQIRNSTFRGISMASGSGPSDGIQIVGGSTNVVVGPNNVFSGILESLCGAVHCDAIQDYGGGPNNKIDGNYFVNGDTFIMMPDGSSNYTVTNNIFDGRGVSYIDKIQFGTAANPVFRHNTIRQVRVSFDSKVGNPASSNVLAQDNILLDGSSWKTSNGSGCSSCVFSFNLYDSTSSARGTDNLLGTPTFIGGVSPATWAGYQLATSSLGYRVGSDGLDMGVTTYGSATVNEPPPAGSLQAPTNLRIISVSYNEARIQWDFSGSGQSGFAVHRKVAAGGTYSEVGTTAALSYTDSSVSPSTGYCYNVEAYNSSTRSSPSNELCLTSSAAPSPTTGQTLLTSQMPQIMNATDGVPYELGMRFIAGVAGKITAIRFFKGSAESGTRTGKIYSSTGALLASVSFTNMTASGWQQATLPAPLSITANTVYTVSVNTGGDYYVATNQGMATQIVNGDLRSVVGNNGVFGPVDSAPTSSWENSNYFRDVVFLADTATSPPPPPTADTTAPIARITSPTDGSFVPKGTRITLQAEASDNVAVTKVEFYVNGSLKCTDSTSAYSCRWAVTTKAGRVFKLQVKAYDAAGNFGLSPIVQVTSK